MHEYDNYLAAKNLREIAGCVSSGIPVGYGRTKESNRIEIILNPSDDERYVSGDSLIYLLNQSPLVIGEDFDVEAVTNVYAPYYRQISFAGIMQDLFLDGLTNTIRKNITREDVFAALDYYFENINNGKPFFFASHSQGSACFKIVFDEYMIKHPEYMDRLIASYNIGYYFPDTWFEANPHIKKAAGETDTGCLICWNTEVPGEKENPGANGASDGFCINPLNWKTDETPAPLSANLGSVEVGDDNVQVFVDGKADAAIDLSRGALICTTDTKDAIYGNPAFEDGSMHFEDCALYYNNIIENAQKRMNAFLGK